MMRKIKIGNKEYGLHYGQNALCALEDELGESISTLTGRLHNGAARLIDLRALLWAGLLKEDRALTPDGVGDLCDAAGVAISSLIPACLEEFNASFRRLIPDAETPEEKPEKNA